jgi:hypothetical protein
MDQDANSLGWVGNIDGGTAKVKHGESALWTDVPFFQDDYKVSSDHATDCCLKHVWEFQQEVAIQVEHTFPVMMKQTKHDEYRYSFSTDTVITILDSSISVNASCRH